MAIFAKKLYIKNSTGNEQTALLYSTTGEVGEIYANLIVDGQTCYVPLVSTENSSATSGRIKKSDGTTYAIAQATTPEYAYTTITTAGSGTFTVPTGVYKLRVTCVGGGAGGTYNGWIYYLSGSGRWDFSPAAGGTTTFGGVTANGASAPYYEGKITGSGETASGSIVNIKVSDGLIDGIVVVRTTSYYAGAPATALTNKNGTTICTAGAGGYADDDGETITTGGSGFRTVADIAVTPGQIISYTVGAGGKNSTNGLGGWVDYPFSSSGQGTGPGGSGAILVEYGKGV